MDTRSATGAGRNGAARSWRPSAGSGYRQAAIAAVWACVIAAPIAAAGGWAIYADWRERENTRQAAAWAGQAYERLVTAAPQPVVDVGQAVHGRELFSTVCFACHGMDGTGIPDMGKNLVESDFVAAESDEALHRFLVTGRPVAKPMPMPPRGGREDLTDDDLRAIVAYMRGLQDPRRMPGLPAVVASAAPTEEQKAAALASAGGDAELAEYIASGNKLFHSTCIACHGKGGVGVAGNGKALVKNPFVGGLDDDGLLAFIKQGRPPTDPKNTTGIQMPPKGGNPALSDDDILDIIAYLRTLQGDKPAAAAGS